MSKSKKMIRAEFRDSVFKRDRNKCVFCDVKTELDAHHINDRDEMPGGGYVKENGITVCKKHHERCEAWYVDPVANYEFSPTKLFSIIASSPELAYSSSVRKFGSQPKEK